ncbi:hypothetical protein DNTS_021000 [Danionella cerebrum]|uniref:Beta-lactamase-related domain-containing protein n=1 Tax=Danionella cerebrum TaxID=2873325 RepID=A0A553Q3Z1_9TELE|nr:hypothetical protein DNTS_021000 [Danionella translucida]
MSNLLCLSRRFFCATCRARVEKPVCSLSVFTLRNQLLRRHLWTRRWSDTAADRKTRSVLLILGVGTGFLLSLGLKNHWSAYELCECKVEKTDRVQTSQISKYTSAIETSRDLLKRIKNRVPCDPNTVMRIASISKSLTAAAVARLWEDGKIDLDAPVQKYVPEFPEKQFEGENVIITPRMLLSHLSGIRHYEKDAKKVRHVKEKAKCLLKTSAREEQRENKAEKEAHSSGKEVKGGQRKKEFEQEEYYIKDNFESVIQALDLFKDDPLIFKPGSVFLYSTHAFTLLSAVVERAANQGFLVHMMAMFRELGMMNTVPDENEPIIYNRSRFYHFSKKGRVVNCPYVDNSYKWAGGGFLSTVGDLLIFGNALLYSYQVENTPGQLPGFLKHLSAKAMWSPVDRTEAAWDRDGRYAQGWVVVEKQQNFGQCRQRRHYVSHTGGAVGASSVLLVLPREEELRPLHPPHGVVVSIITNMQSVGLNTTALKIAHEFDKATPEKAPAA